MLNFNLKRFYELLLEAVKFYTPKEECRQVNTFSIIQHIDDLNKTDLGLKGEDLGYENWVRGCAAASKVTLEYPFLFAADFGGVINCPFEEDASTQNHTSLVYSLRIGIVDTFKRDKKNYKGCEGRSETEIFSDTTYALLGVFDYFKNVRIFLVQNNDNTNHYGFYNEQFLEYCKLNGDIDNYWSLDHITFAEKQGLNAIECQWKEAMCFINDSMELERFRHESKDDLVGTIISIKIPETYCKAAQFEFSKEDRTIINKSCC